MKAAASTVKNCGTIDVELDIPEVIQIFPKVKGTINNVNHFMKPFLKIFGMEYGNGISPFAVDMDDPSDLRKLITYLFHPTKRYPM